MPRGGGRLRHPVDHRPRQGPVHRRDERAVSRRYHVPGDHLDVGSVYETPVGQQRPGARVGHEALAPGGGEDLVRRAAGHRLGRVGHPAYRHRQRLQGRRAAHGGGHDRHNRLGTCRFGERRIKGTLMAHSTISAGELHLVPVTVEQARAIVAGDLVDLAAGDGWPTEDTVAGMTMVSLGRIEAWLVTLGGTVIGDVGASVAGDTAEFAYTLAEPYRGMGFEQAIGLALPPELAARPGVVAVRDGSRAAVDRRPPRVAAGERDTLLAFLDYLRESLIGKLDGLSEEDARRSLVPSGTSLLGLVKHVAQAEHSWVLYSWAGGDD